MFQKPGNIADFCNFFDLFLFFLFFSVEHFFQIFPHGFLYEKALGILWQHSQQTVKKLSGFIFVYRFSLDTDLSTVWFTDVGNRLQSGRFTGSVTAYNGEQRVFRNLECDPFENIRGVLLIAEPAFFYQNGRVFYIVRICGDLFRYCGIFRCFVFKNPAAPVAAFTDCQRTFLKFRYCGPVLADVRIFYPVKDLYRCGHCGKHPVIALTEKFSDLTWFIVRDHFSVFNHNDFI